MSSVTTDTAVTSVPNTAKDELSILRVHTYDRTAGIATQERVLQVLSAELQNAKNGTLKELRGVLIAKNVFNSRTISSPFCDINGSEMDDDILTKTYIKLVDSETHTKMTSLEGSQVAPDELSVYYKKQPTAMDDATKGFLDKPLDLDLKEGQQLSKTDIAQIKSAFEAKTWTAAEKKTSLSHAATLSEKEWDIITRTNCLLSGHKIVQFEKTIGGSTPVTPNKPDKPSSRSKVRGKTVKDLKVERTPYNGTQKLHYVISQDEWLLMNSI
ncbi:unnamed protein product [Penicillium crustosum]